MKSWKGTALGIAVIGLVGCGSGLEPLRLVLDGGGCCASKGEGYANAYPEDGHTYSTICFEDDSCICQIDNKTTMSFTPPLCPDGGVAYEYCNCY